MDQRRVNPDPTFIYELNVVTASRAGSGHDDTETAASVNPDGLREGVSFTDQVSDIEIS